MKKVININFQGRVIPIEETAYDILKQYVESLRLYFANEEGRDEIINDIEGRIAELFSETLKKGSTCITDEDVTTVINSIGRPEDFDGEEAKVQTSLGAESGQQEYQSYNYSEARTKRLYRDEDDKILGGVCAGLANYLRIDPAIIRILFAVITFGGFGAGFLIYVLMWAILPGKKLERGVIRKRLFRNPDDKVIAGVASGIAAYFNIAVWIPRLIFAFPLVIGVISSIFRGIFGHFDPAPTIIFNSFGGTFFIVYVVLWIVIPEANSASEKLEMRGEKIDLNSIRDTIQEDLGNFKHRAEKWSTDVKEKAQKWGKEFGETVGTKGQQFGKEVSVAATRTGSRFGHAVGIIFKAFFLFIAGVIAFALLMALFGLLVGGVSVLPLKSFFLHGFWQNFLAWGTLILFIGVPIIGLLTWLIRRIIRVKSSNPYLGWIFGGLWTLGWICAIFLIASVANDYKTRSGVEDSVNITQPTSNKLFITMAEGRINFYGSDWFGINWDDDNPPFYGIAEDSLLLRTVRVIVVKSNDSAFHVQMVKFSRGSNPSLAEQYARSIDFKVQQTDSVLILPKGFTISSNDKFHNQQVLLVVEVPVGKKVEMDRSLNDYNYFNINFGNGRFYNDWDRFDESFYWQSNTEYIMTDKGLKASSNDNNSNDDEINDKQKELQDIQQQKKELEDRENELKQSLPQDSTINRDSTRYQYKPAPAVEKPVTKQASYIEIKEQLPLNISSLIIEKYSI